MATNTFAPTGFVFSRNLISNSPTFQANGATIKRAYASNIGIGDVVKTLTGASQGYIGLGTNVDTALLGIFCTITSLASTPGQAGGNGGGYFDINTQTYSYGLNGSYVSTMLPPVGIDVGALVISDPFAVFRVQMLGAYTQSMAGNNVNFVANGAPNASGISTAYVDAATVAATNTLPFRIIGLAGMLGGPQDPTNTNPWIEVRLNTAEMLQSAGI